jgi:hypothetical protein
MKVAGVACLCLVAVQLSASGQTTAPAAKPVISLAIHSIASIQAGSKVFIHVVLTNTSAHDIVVEREVRGTDCAIDVRDEKGKLAPDTKYGLVTNGHVNINDLDLNTIDPQDLTGALVSIPVKAGKTWEWGLDATQRYDMSKPGKYQIFVEKLDPENPALKAVRSNTISVTVMP